MSTTASSKARALVCLFMRDTRTESFLKQMRVDFKFTNQLTVGDLVANWRKVNLSRPRPVIDDAVFEYAALMESGSLAPAPILYKTPNGYSILDGVQRIVAANELQGVAQLAAYVVTCDSENKLAAIDLLANARLQGRAEPMEWTRKRAVEVLVVQRGMSIEEVARMGGWRKSDIQAIVNAIEWNNEIQSIGGPELNAKLIGVVSKHVSKEDLRVSGGPAADFLKVVKGANFSSEDAEPHIKDFFQPVVKKSKRHDTLKDRLKSFKAEPEVQVRLCGRKGTGLTHDVNLRRAMKTVITVLEEVKKSGDSLLYVDEFFKLSGEISERLHALAPSHKKPVVTPTPADKWS